jgi:hypothetical protein
VSDDERLWGKLNKKGCAELKRAAREHAKDSFSHAFMLEQLEDVVREFKQSLKGTAHEIADHLVAWTTQVEVFLDWRGREGDITLELLSDTTVLSTVPLSELLQRDISIMTDDDIEEGKRDGLSSKAWVKRKFAKGLRCLADDIEKGKFDE